MEQHLSCRRLHGYNGCDSGYSLCDMCWTGGGGEEKRDGVCSCSSFSLHKGAAVKAEGELNCSLLRLPGCLGCWGRAVESASFSNVTNVSRDLAMVHYKTVAEVATKRTNCSIPGVAYTVCRTL